MCISTTLHTYVGNRLHYGIQSTQTLSTGEYEIGVQDFCHTLHSICTVSAALQLLLAYAATTHEPTRYTAQGHGSPTNLNVPKELLVVLH